MDANFLAGGDCDARSRVDAIELPEGESNANPSGPDNTYAKVSDEVGG